MSAASAAYCAPVATSDLPEPVGVARTTFAPLTNSISASSCAGYSTVPCASAHSAKEENNSSASPPFARSADRSFGSSSRGAVIVRTSVPDRDVRRRVARLGGRELGSNHDRQDVVGASDEGRCGGVQRLLRKDLAAAATTARRLFRRLPVGPR